MKNTNYSAIKGNGTNKEFDIILNRARELKRDTNIRVSLEGFSKLRIYATALFLNGITVVLFPPNVVRFYDSAIQPIEDMNKTV